MHLQFVHPAGSKRICGWIGPHIAPRAPVLAKFKGVDMGRFASFIDQYQLVLTAIEAALSGSGLVPDTDVFEFVIDGCAGREQLVNMTPIHTDIGDAAINSVAGTLS